MSFNRKIRVEYYQVVEARKDGGGKDKVFNLEELIFRADSLTPAKLTYDYYQEKARLDKYSFNRTHNCYYLSFIRLRQTKIPVKAKMDSESNPIELENDEYIGEDVSAVYDKPNHILAIQRNRDSLSASGIEYYLTQLYNSQQNGIYLRAVPFKGVENRLRRAKTYRKITMKFATSNHKNTSMPEDTSFGRMLSFVSPYNARNCVLSISMGKYKGSMSADTVTEVINEIKNTGDLVTGAELSVKYNDEEPVDTIDLFSMKYHNFFTIKIEELKSIDYMDMCNEIRSVYFANRSDILEAI